MRVKTRIAVGILAAAALAAAVVSAGTAAVAASTTSEAPKITVTCGEPDENGVAVCSVTSSRSFSGGEQIEFSATLPDGRNVTGATGNGGATGLRPIWCSDGMPSSLSCYSFSLETVDQPTSTPISNAQEVDASADSVPESTASVTADNEASILGAAPCPQQPELTCITQPSGPNVVTIHVTAPGEGVGPSVTINKDGETTEHDATGYHRSQQDAETTQTWQDDVDDAVDDDDLAVMWAAHGLESPEEQLNKRRLEEELYNAGQPYVVCFEDLTFTRTKKDGTTEEVTVPGGDCVVVTPPSS